MLFRDQIYLLKPERVQDDYGGWVDGPEVARSVFANEKSVTQSEFYNAAIAGFKPEILFEVRTIEYQGEPTLRFREVDYRVIRTYSRNREISEIVCEKVVGDS